MVNVSEISSSIYGHENLVQILENVEIRYTRQQNQDAAAGEQLAPACLALGIVPAAS